jgi:hypothetical protein
MSLTVNGVDIDTALLEAQRFLPHLDSTSELAIAAPGVGEGFWTGAPSAFEHDGIIYLAYRVRQPIALGRGQGVVIAKSSDGVHFDTIQTIDKTSMDAESLERPTLLRTAEGSWRLYLSCATTGTKHWRVELLEAASPDSFDPTTRKVVMPGDEHWAVKDTVIAYRNGQWHCWATFHPLDEAHHEDRMVSRYATSADGIEWDWRPGDCLEPRAGMWDERGARVTAVYFADDYIVAFYDGRATAAENYEERTGIAVGTTADKFVAFGDAPFGQSANERGLRYLDVVPLSDGSFRTYYEVATDDDSHELRTEHIDIV